MKNGTRVKEYTGYDDEGEPIRASEAIGTVIGAYLDEDDNPTSHLVRWDDGRLSPSDCLDDVTPCLYVNIYLHDRAYGGGEEGGWFYPTYSPEEEECRVFATPEEALSYLPTAQAWCDEENGCRRSDVSSVLSEGKYVAQVEAWPAEHTPQQRPHYC